MRWWKMLKAKAEQEILNICTLKISLNSRAGRSQAILELDVDENDFGKRCRDLLQDRNHWTLCCVDFLHAAAVGNARAKAWPYSVKLAVIVKARCEQVEHITCRILRLRLMSPAPSLANASKPPSPRKTLLPEKASIFYIYLYGRLIGL